MNRGVGRGKAATLPAWMTSGDGNGISQASLNSSIVSSNSTIPNASSVTNTQPVPPPPGPPTQRTTPAMLQPASILTSSTTVPSVASIQTFSAPPSVPQMIPGHIFVPPPTMPATYQPAPVAFHPPPMAYPRPVPIPPPPLSTGDPNNEVVNWSVHSAEDGKKYWYNKVTNVSTYDKPFCLKTPEERSIPPCKWKEYSSGGQKYYSDGVESVWEEPVEYREWREKIEAIEAKATALKGSFPSSKEEQKKKGIPTPTTVTYATQAEALEAFYALLDEKKVSATVKVKDVKDICQDDPRWNALKTTGERNQAIAEYQTKKLKQERESKQSKLKKQKDAFLVMLAEETKIDARTRWSDAIVILKDDTRYKNLDDPREREDLFTEFISELTKKEREDKMKLKDAAMRNLSELLDNLRDKGVITRQTLWGDHRDVILSYTKGADIKGLDEIDIKRVVQDLVSKLELQYREEERARKDQRMQILRENQRSFHVFLEILCKKGLIKPDDRWIDIADMSSVKESQEYQELIQACDKLIAVEAAIREVIEKFISNLRESLRSDRRVFKDCLYELKLNIDYDTSFSQVKSSLLKFASMNEKLNEETGHSEFVELLGEKSFEEDVVQVPRSKESISLSTSLREIFKERPFHIQLIFEDYHRQAVIMHDEDAKAQKRREDRFIELLESYFYRSDHINIEWDDAKKLLDRHSAYDALSRSDRKRLFNDYISDLRKKMESRIKQMKKPLAHMNVIEEGEERSSETEEEIVYPREKSMDTGKRSRSNSDSASDDSDSDSNSGDERQEDKAKKPKKEKKEKKDKHKHKKHKRERHERGEDEHDRKKRHRSKS